MAKRLSDSEIQGLIVEKKSLAPGFKRQFLPKPKRGHKESECSVSGQGGSQFKILIRQSEFNPLDFSAILAYCVPNTNQVFRLRRYNGKSHEHTNSLEGETFFDFHVHEATERYQELGSKEDTFAVPTDRYDDLQGALGCLILECGFELPLDHQMGLFEV